MSDIFGIDRGVASPTVITGCVLTPEYFEAARVSMLANFGSPPVEMHAPTCPKIRTRGRKACRCGSVPSEAWCEDAAKAERKASRRPKKSR